MKPDPMDRIEQLFAEASGLPEAERQGFLRRACPNDSATFDEVCSLLRAHEAAGEFLEDPAVRAHHFIRAAVGRAGAGAEGA